MLACHTHTHTRVHTLPLNHQPNCVSGKILNLCPTKDTDDKQKVSSAPTHRTNGRETTTLELPGAPGVSRS